MRPAYEVADVLRTHWPKVESSSHFNRWQLRTLGALMRCRTAAIGGHVDACTRCGAICISYNSCRNRHCPKCQGKNRKEWISKREADLLPVPYFHVVFTLPYTMHSLALYKPREVYNILFETAWATVKTFAADPKHLGAQTGMIAILHTWGQTLTLHPHLHCIIPGGGLNPQGKWKTARSKGKFLFPVKAMSIVFRAKYIAALREALPETDKKILNTLFKQAWVVYAKRAFAGPHSVIEYLGRYTHKVAISNHRLLSVDASGVTFTHKDYRHGAKKYNMTLAGMEFIRRFSQHILPKKFVRIRHFGILSSTTKKISIPLIRQQLPEKPAVKKCARVLQPFNPLLCPCCKTESMVTIEIFGKRGPPHNR